MNDYIEATEWGKIQAQYADIPGEEGVQLRRHHYAKFFLRFGQDVMIEEGCRFYHPQHIVLNDDVRINLRGLFYGSGGIYVGRHARIGPNAFIHSANHDIASDSSQAFFERGYDYQQVVIGNNSLISANVSIMPGAKLGDGTFVACGAVVPGSKFNPNAYLFGVPAQERTTVNSDVSIESSPDIALISPADNSIYYDATLLLQEVLGLPQIICLRSGEVIPNSVQNIVLFGSTEIPALDSQAKVWRVIPGNIPVDYSEGNDLQLATPSGDGVSIPHVRKLIQRPVANKDSELDQRLSVIAFWLDVRLSKRNNALSVSEFKEWLTFIACLNWSKAPSEIDHVLSQLVKRWPETLNSHSGSLPAHKTKEEIDSLVTSWMLLSDGLPDSKPNSLLSFIPKKNKSVEELGATVLTRKQALTQPYELVWRSLNARDDELVQIVELLDDLAPHCNTSIRLVALGLAAKILNVDKHVIFVREKMNSPERWPESGVLPLQLPERSNLLLSPLYFAWVLLGNDVFDVPEGIFDPTKIEVDQLAWSGFESTENEWQCVDGVALINESSGCVSEDLIANWLRLQKAPCAKNTQIELTSDNYSDSIYSLECVWLGFFKRIQNLQEKPLIQLSPWPAPYQSALSLRYDVDRPISIARASELTGIQARYANASFGSWYFRSVDHSVERVSSYLLRTFQEIGKHIESLDEVCESDGITHHSAPTSCYWQGDHTSRHLKNANAGYGEFLAGTLFTPRRAFVDSSLTDLVLTPLHFPLEAGTDDKSLDYFDKLIAPFRQRMNSGGHAIISSHPDLDQTLLTELLEREDLSQVWLAPVNAVAQRFHLVMIPGAVKAVTDSSGEFCLYSNDNVADLTGYIYYPSGKKDYFQMQLQAGVPRKIDFPKIQEENI